MDYPTSYFSAFATLLLAPTAWRLLLIFLSASEGYATGRAMAIGILIAHSILATGIGLFLVFIPMFSISVSLVAGCIIAYMAYVFALRAYHGVRHLPPRNIEISPGVLGFLVGSFTPLGLHTQITALQYITGLTNSTTFDWIALAAFGAVIIFATNLLFANFAARVGASNISDSWRVAGNGIAAFLLLLSAIQTLHMAATFRITL